MDTNPTKVLKQFREFLIFCKKQLGLKKLPKIHWHSNDDVGMTRPSFGSFENETQEIKIGINNRHPLDVMRTLAHELTHYKQFLDGKLHPGSGETGSPAENEANAMAGIIMRDWNVAHEEMFRQDEIDENVLEGVIQLGKKKDGKAAKWVDHMYATLPKNPMNPDQIALVYGEGNDQGLALIELVPDAYDTDAASIKWIQTYPQRTGVGRKALAELQELAAEAGVHLTLTAWKHGKVPERALKKFYKSMGFGQDTKSGQMKWAAPVAESAADEVPQSVWQFLDTLGADDVGKERIDDYVVHYEGFSDWCQSAASERTELPPTDPQYLANYDDIYDEVLQDFIKREHDSKPVASGLVGDELYPIVYAVFHKPELNEGELNRIDQFNRDGGSLEGYVVDTDQPQLENYLTSQGASIDLVRVLQKRYHRIGILRNMWVDEDLRGGGIGSDMLEAAIGDAFGFGADAIMLVADMAEDNAQLGKPLDQWYAGWGFKTVGSAGGDPVMILDYNLTESWSKKYKKSINCSHPKGFSQKAHCAGRRARQAGKKTKSKSISEVIVDNHNLTEARKAFLAYAKSKFPNMPDYVAYELIYKNSKMNPSNVTGVWTKYYGSYNWNLVKDFKINNSIWDRETSDRIRARLGKPGDNDTFPKDRERFAQQRKMIQQRGVSQEPIIVEESREDPGKYTLLEGWHRTIEALRAYPDGFTCPAYVGSPTATTEKIRAKVPDSFWQKFKKRALGENLFANNEQRFDRKHLDKCLVELCEMIVKGQQTDPNKFGMVAAAVIDPNHNQTASTSTKEDNKWKHAERNAIEKYNELYGEIPEGSIIVTTLSPCDNAMSDRYGHSCTDLINQCPINEVYCGYMDPSQLDEDFEFTVEDTKNSAIQELCKKFAASFLVNENFADGKGPGRPGDSQRHGIPKGATIAQLEKAAKAPGRKGQLARWQLNMRRGRAKHESTIREIAKVELSTDPNNYGAYVKDVGKPDPTTYINFDQIASLFEPEGKMKLPKSSANVDKIAAGIKRGDELPPLLVRRVKGGYQVLDGHHRYEAYKRMHVKRIPVRIVDPKNIKTKNTESISEGIEAFHSSATPTISKFNSFTHFGTEKAAADRIKFLIKQKKLAKDSPVTVYKIDLNIHKPAVIKDAAVQHDSTQYAFALKDAKIFTQEEMMSITGKKALMPGGWDQAAYDQTEKESLELLKDLLKSKGYDGLAYKNKHEDKGNMSYVILDPKQARVVGKETVPANELVNKFAVTTEARAYLQTPSQSKDVVTHMTFKPKVVVEFPDGPVVDTLHVLERMTERGIYESTLIKVINDAAKFYAEKLRNMSNQGFIIKQNLQTGNYKGGVGAAVHKVSDGKGKWKYVIKTVHSNMHVLRKPLEEILFIPPLTPKQEKNFLNLQKQALKENDILDKPTPTVGDLAEKYHTSLLAVKQQLVKGIRVELEHTSKISVAKEIALDHLGEDLYYYKKLAKVEKK